MIYESKEQLQKIFEIQDARRWEIAKTSARERIAKLKKLRKAIVRRQEELYKAIWEDFHKSRFETWLCEVFPTIEEIDCAISNLEEWIEDKSGEWVFFMPTNKSVSHFEAKGHVLVMAPWNYPFLLFVSPIVSAIAAGNVIIGKPSHKTPRTSAFMANLFEEVFDKSEVAVIEGPGTKVGDELLQLKFDHVFFTGSPSVGAHIGELSQKIHAGITLELGGKSPVVILEDANLDLTAKKLAWGKTLNGGQTCIAPDYVLCPKNLVQILSEKIAKEIKKSYGETDEERKTSNDFVRIIESRAVIRHKELIEDAIAKGANQILGGTCDIENRYTPATILTNITEEMSIMDSEIFGPILPILAYDKVEDAVKFIQKRPKPLSLYIFGKSDGSPKNPGINYVIENTTAGSTCVNNCILQIENLSVPFGGVGMSGLGNYHGIYGFKTFSHERNVMRQGSLDLVDFFHAPYCKNANDEAANGQSGIKNKSHFLQSISRWALNFIKRI